MILVKIAMAAGFFAFIIGMIILKKEIFKDVEKKLHYNYITNYSLDLCLEYMQHDNVYDKFEYAWEKKEDHYLITFIEYKNSMLSLANAFKPTFKVIFENMGNQTGISVQFIKEPLQSVPNVYTRDIDAFWQKKLDAEKVK